MLGNGPQLSSIDFSELENEFVFTVNQIARKQGFEKLKTNFHVWADPFFFKLDLEKQEDKELFNQMLNIKKGNNNPICFFPLDSKDFVEKNIGNSLKTSYFLPCYSIRFRMKKRINFCSVTPSFYTVVQHAIALAIYMGFKEIYLLGCETSNIITSLNTRMNCFDPSSYSYELTENEKNRMKKVSKMTSIADDLYNNLNVFEDYSYLKQYCIRRGVKLVNCTEHSLIECLEYIPFKKVLYD